MCTRRRSQLRLTRRRLRSHTTAGVPPALRALAGTDADEADVLLALPGVCHRRDSIDRLHVGTPHQVDLWRIATTGSAGRRLDADDLQQMVELVVGAVLPGARWRTSSAQHPYTTGGLQVDVCTASGWVELAECGLAAGHVLSGLQVQATTTTRASDAIKGLVPLAAEKLPTGTQG